MLEGLFWVVLIFAPFLFLMVPVLVCYGLWLLKRRWKNESV